MGRVAQVAGLCVGLVVALVACQLASGQPEEWTDQFLEGVKVVWAGPGDELVGFEATHKALKNMLAEMNKGENRAGIDKIHQLASTRAKITAFLDACKLERPKCLTIFGAIDLMLEDEPEDAINLVPYLHECQQRQTDFCSGKQKPGKAGSNLLEKIVTACWSKGEKKNCKN